MPGNTFGQLFSLTTFGESHGVGLGGVVDGCPPGIELSEAVVQAALDQRKPGGAQAGSTSTARREPDAVRLYSGVFEGRTTGTPIGFVIENTDQRSRDYSKIKDVYRPGHADLTFDKKFGCRDYRGGGRSSGRETACRVAGGAVAGAFLATQGIEVSAYTLELGGVRAEIKDIPGAASRPFFAPDDAAVEAFETRVSEAKGENDTLGGLVEVRAQGVPAGLGEPVFDKLDARLAYALMSIGAVKGVEIGAGFAAARLTGSKNNDPLVPADVLSGLALPDGLSNNAGGILGGISSGREILARVAVKPIASIAKEQRTVTTTGEATTIRVGGRHDISAIPRIVPVVAAMVRLVLADFLLLQRRMQRRTA